MSRKNGLIDKMIENVYRFVGCHAGGPGIPGAPVVLTTDSQKRRTP